MLSWTTVADSSEKEEKKCLNYFSVVDSVKLNIKAIITFFHGMIFMRHKAIGQLLTGSYLEGFVIIPFLFGKSYKERKGAPRITD